MINNRFWCVNAFFNPAGYRSRLENHQRFAERMARQGVNLLTIELAFDGQEHQVPGSLRLCGHSVLWQKERLLNHAIASLPATCDRVAWLDGDLLLPDGWDALVLERLERCAFVQVYQEVAHLKPGQTRCDGDADSVREGIARQKRRAGPGWLSARLAGTLLHAEPGFGWAARRAALAGGLYDRFVLGGGDSWLADCLLGCESVHQDLYQRNLTPAMRADMAAWKAAFPGGDVEYAPIRVAHLWHGAVTNRQYLTRDQILRRHRFDPRTDIRLERDVWEWASDKPGLHRDVLQYFRSRLEDGGAAAATTRWGGWVARLRGR
jgi:hypothetical protein